MELNFDYLKELYFTFDESVPYLLKCGKELQIKPILLKDSLIFNTSYGILDIDKNSLNNPEIISMSYLKFLLKFKISNNFCKQQLYNICNLCLGLNCPYITLDEKGRAILCEINEGEIIYVINQKEFDDIKRIILYQNLLDYNDDYINPDLKKSMNEQDELKFKNIEIPSLERKIAIISSHTGILPKEQFGMTLRSHSLLFKEVASEVNFQATKALSLYANQPDSVQWIYKKKQDKFDNYITTVEEYNKSFGGDGKVLVSNTLPSTTENDINNFINNVKK